MNASLANKSVKIRIVFTLVGLFVTPSLQAATAPGRSDSPSGDWSANRAGRRGHGQRPDQGS